MNLEMIKHCILRGVKHRLGEQPSEDLREAKLSQEIKEWALELRRVRGTISAELLGA